MSLDDFKPYPKEAQLARKTKKYRRQVASPKRWAAIADAKQGPCRLCGAAPPNNMAHIVDRGHGGSDTEANILPLCGSGTTGCHGLVTARDRDACRRLMAALTDDEYAYMVERGGETYAERRYGLTYARPEDAPTRGD